MNTSDKLALDINKLLENEELMKAAEHKLMSDRGAAGYKAKLEKYGPKKLAEIARENGKQPCKRGKSRGAPRKKGGTRDDKKRRAYYAARQREHRAKIKRTEE